MGDRVWVCTREPLLNALGAPLHPCVILIVLFAALTFGKWRRERWRRLAHDLWRYLLVAAVLVTAFFFFIALLTRLAFGADPSPLVRWVSVARGLAAALAGWLVWRRRDTASALSPGPLAVLHLGGCRPTRIARACWMASRAPWARMRGASVVIDVTGRVAPRCLSGTHPNHAAHRSRAARGTKPPGEVRGRSASAHLSPCERRCAQAALAA